MLGLTVAQSIATAVLPYSSTTKQQLLHTMHNAPQLLLRPPHPSLQPLRSAQLHKTASSTKVSLISAGFSRLLRTNTRLCASPRGGAEPSTLSCLCLLDRMRQRPCGIRADLYACCLTRCPPLQPRSHHTAVRASTCLCSTSPELTSAPRFQHMTHAVPLPVFLLAAGLLLSLHSNHAAPHFNLPCSTSPVHRCFQHSTPAAPLQCLLLAAAGLPPSCSTASFIFYQRRCFSTARLRCPFHPCWRLLAGRPPAPPH